MKLAFLNPSALWLLTALAIPVIIHLLHRGQSQRVLVGSVRFLKGRETQTLTRLKLTEKRLLVLRLIMLTLLACLLAQPFVRSEPKAEAPSGWLLIDPRLAEVPFTPELGDLYQLAVTEKWRISWLANEFPEYDPSAPIRPEILDGQVWSLAAEAAFILPDDRALHVITPGYAQDFEGERPLISQPEMGWHHMSKKEADPQLLAGYRLDERRFVFITGKLVNNQWQRSRHVVNWDGSEVAESIEGLPPIQIKAANKMIDLRFKGDPESQLTLSSETVPVQIALVSPDEQSEDVRLLKIALETVASHYQWPLEIRTVNPEAFTSESPGWSFWLGVPEKDIPATLSSAAGVVFRDAGDAPYDQATAALNWEGHFPGEPPQLTRRVAPRPQGTTVWRDAWGVPTLQLEENEGGAQYYFASRFLPEWSDVAFHQAFPMWLAEFLETQWLADQPHPMKRVDARVLPEDQAKPRLMAGEALAKEAVIISLSFYFWILLLGAFILERWWSIRRQTR